MMCGQKGHRGRLHPVVPRVPESSTPSKARSPKVSACHATCNMRHAAIALCQLRLTTYFITNEPFRASCVLIAPPKTKDAIIYSKYINRLTGETRFGPLTLAAPYIRTTGTLTLRYFKAKRVIDAPSETGLLFSTLSGRNKFPFNVHTIQKVIILPAKSVASLITTSYS